MCFPRPALAIMLDPGDTNGRLLSPFQASTARPDAERKAQTTLSAPGAFKVQPGSYRDINALVV
jgi:hypothetical protein